MSRRRGSEPIRLVRLRRGEGEVGDDRWREVVGTIEELPFASLEGAGVKVIFLHLSASPRPEHPVAALWECTCVEGDVDGRAVVGVWGVGGVGGCQGGRWREMDVRGRQEAGAGCKRERI
jgi:hypothetical protein